MAERFEIEQREEWGVINETGGSRKVNTDPPDEVRARYMVSRFGGEVVHRMVYVWTGEWKPEPEPHELDPIPIDGPRWDDPPGYSGGIAELGYEGDG